MNYTSYERSYAPRSISAAVLGADVEVSSERVEAGMRQLSGMSVDEGLKWYMNVLDKVNVDLRRIYTLGQARHTSEEAYTVWNRGQALLAASAAMGTVYSDFDFASERSTQWSIIKNKIQQIMEMLNKMGTWDPRVGEIRAAILARRDEALRQVDLDSPYVGPGERRATLEWAYDPHNTDPDAVAIREKYNRDGTLKSGEKVSRLDPVQRLAFIHQHFKEAEVELPAVMKPTAEQTERYLKAVGYTAPEVVTAAPQQGGMGAGAVLGVAAAAAVAFFALRG